MYATKIGWIKAFHNPKVKVNIKWKWKWIMGADIKREDRCIKLGRSNQKKLDAQKYNLDHNIRGIKKQNKVEVILRGVKKHKSTIWKGSFLPETQYKRGQKVKKRLEWDKTKEGSKAQPNVGHSVCPCALFVLCGYRCCNGWLFHIWNHICHGIHGGHPWRKFCPAGKLYILVSTLVNNLVGKFCKLKIIYDHWRSPSTSVSALTWSSSWS